MTARRYIAILLLALAGLVPAGAATFATQRLQAVAKALQLPGLEQLKPGTYTHYQYRQHALTVRVNGHGEVEHIGLCLFPQWRRDAAVSPIYDFLERSLLERLLPNLDEGVRFKLAGEQMVFVKGSPQTALAIDTTHANGFGEERIDFRTYRVTWQKEGKECLVVSFPMDYQMLSGCDAIELDSRFMRQLRRFKPHSYQPRQFDFPEHTSTYVAAGDTFLIRGFHNELYYENRDGTWLLADGNDPSYRTLSNMLLSMDFAGSPTLTVSLDQLSDEKTPLTVPYKHFLQLCIDEGCTPFFGIKDKTPEGYKATVLMTNERAGYVHLMSVTVPLSTVENKGNGPVRGYLYVYIPMHNVSNDYFRK